MTQAFAQFGDTASYTLAPGGAFEGAWSTWTLGSNALVAGNDAFYLNAATDKQSVSIAPGTSVTSPAFCVDATNPFLRLVTKKATKGSIKVEALYVDDMGAAKTQNLGSVIQGGTNANGDYTNWAPSPVLKFGTALPIAKFASGTMKCSCG